MNDFTKLPYAAWLEESLTSIFAMPVESICIMTRLNSGDIGVSFYECNTADKIMFAGYLQQDAMIDSLKANGLIPDDEDDVEEEN